MRTTDDGRRLVLDAEPDGAARARRHVTATLSGEAPEAAAVAAADLLDDAHLVVTELVTNAQLHGVGPITVLVRPAPDDGGLRIEVRDQGPGQPVLPVHSTEAMTGRGLALVAALTEAWGVEPLPGGGKSVWASLPRTARSAAADTPTQPLDVEALLAAYPDDDVAPARPVAGEDALFEVRLGSVPTDLLLDAKRQIDNVVRELTLERASAAEQPPALRALIETVTTDFAAARTGIKHQAIAAAARGEEETELVLSLPLSAADAGERYLAALDEADAHSREVRLLTLEAPPLHRVFRSWYVGAIADQLRALAAGRPAPRARPFVRVLSDEVTTLSALRTTAERLDLLQRIQRELTAVHGQEQVCDVVMSHAAASLGALSCAVYLLGEDGLLHAVRSLGSSPQVVQAYAAVDPEGDLPGALVFRSGTPVVTRSLAQLAERFPSLAGVFPTERALHVVPLTVGGHRLGVMSVTVPPGGRHDEQTLAAFVQALADALAQALERVQAMAAVAQAATRLEFLADASVALSASLDLDQTLAAITDLLVPRLADACTIALVEDGVLQPAIVRHRDPAEEPWVRELAHGHSPAPDAPAGHARVLRTGVSELHEELTDDLLVAAARDAEHLRALREVGVRSAVAVPLPGRDGVLGVLSVVHTGSGRRYAPADVPFLEDVARRAALALETARVLRDQTGRLADVRRIADAAQRAILAPPPPRVGPVALGARYASAATDALVGGDLYEVVARPGGVRLLIGDVKGKGLGAVRTATVVLGEFRAAAADLDDVGLVARQVDRRVRPYLGDEDFVTALVAEVRDDGTYVVASCGHPPALLATPDRTADGGAPAAVTTLHTEPTLPLGLGAEPTVLHGRLVPGDRLLLYTDGILEARDPEGEFVDLVRLVQPLTAGLLSPALDEVLAGLHASAGPDLGDDLALLVAEYAPRID